MHESDYKALLIPGNLARYKEGAFCILVGELKSFLPGHHIFVNSQPDHSAFLFNKKRVLIDNKQEDVYVVWIRRVDDQSPCNINNQLKMDHLPPQINSLRIQQQKFRQEIELAVACVHVDLFIESAEDKQLNKLPDVLTPLAVGDDANGKCRINCNEVW
jgi:hypothetical protein